MKCGLGKRSRCNIGPVFTADQLKALPAEF